MSERTAEEARAEYILKMGAELGEVYNRLYNECAGLHFKWSKFRALFGTSESRVDLLNSIAPQTTRVIQDAMWDDILLHICRLTDNERVAGRRTLTLQKLPRLVDSAIRPTVEAEVSALIQRVGFAKDLRNRRIAHIDLDVALERNTEPLSPASRAMVQNVLDGLAGALNTLEAHYMDSEVAYDMWSGEDAVNLLLKLRDGQRAEIEKEKRVKDGDIRPDDWGPDPI